MNGVVAALISQLMTVPGYARSETGNAPPPPWLVTRDAIQADPIALVVNAWCAEVYKDCPSLDLALNNLKASDLSGRMIELPFTASPDSRSNTARPANLAYTILPAYLADRLVTTEANKDKTTIRIHGQQRGLVRVPSTSGAELMSWPPVYVTHKNQKWGFSYTIAISLQTFAGDPVPRIHFHYGVRRWVSRPMLEDGVFYLDSNARSVYLRTTRDWLLPPGPMFTRASIRAIYNGTKRVPVWTNAIPAIAKRLRIEWPEAEDLVTRPKHYLDEPGVDGITAAIAQRWERHHPIQPGMGFEEHEMLTRRIQRALADDLDLIAPLNRIPPTRKMAKHPLEKNLRDLPAGDRLQALVDSVGPNVTIEVWWATDEGRNMQIDRIRAMLTSVRPQLIEPPPRPAKGADESLQHALQEDDAEDDDTDEIDLLLESLDDEETPDDESVEVEDEPPDIIAPLEKLLEEKAPARKRARVRDEEPSPEDIKEEIEIALPGGRLRIVPRQLGSLGAAFPESPQQLTTKWQRAAYQREQTEARVAKIVTDLPLATEPILSIIELPNYRDPRNPKQRRELGLRDPKRAIRLGFAKTRRVTKFMTGEPEKLRARCTGAVVDGLRQMGYLPAMIGLSLPKNRSFPDNLLIAAIWMVRLTKKRSFVRVHLPIVVLFHTAIRKVRAWIPDGRPARPLYQALLDITTMPPEKVQKNTQAAALNQLRQFLEHSWMAEGAEDLLVLTEAQNIRLTLTGFQNPEIVRDHWRLARESTPVPIDRLRGRVRVVRLRGSANRETPEWYVPDVLPGQGFVQGIWPDIHNDRTFYSIAGKPHTMSGKREGKQVNPREYYALPSMLEIFEAALQPGDDPETWAIAIEQWRKMGYLSGDMTRLPMPLQWAEHVDRYASVIGPWVFNELWGEEDEEGGDEDEDGPRKQLLEV
jgi:hypothetical protein